MAGIVVPYSGAQTAAQTASSETLPSQCSVKDLMERYLPLWNGTYGCFYPLPFSEPRFEFLLGTHNAQFPRFYDPKTEYGWIEKKDVRPNTRIFVRADLHGSLHDLIENLKVLQQQGLLDQNYKCQPDVALVFLGDYADRGNHSAAVLEMLLTLRIENPEQVVLIRGNHEEISMNRATGGESDLKSFIVNPDNPLLAEQHSALLTAAYETMPLAVYVGQAGTERRQYVLFLHGLPDLDVDPSEMLEKESATARMAVPRKRQLSLRITQLVLEPLQGKEGTKLQQAARRVFALFTGEKKRSGEESPYNWGDVKAESCMGTPGVRGPTGWNLNPRDVKQCLRASSVKHPVKMLFRGHQHVYERFPFSETRTVVVSLPIGTDVFSNFCFGPDLAMILQTAPNVKKWTETLMQREHGSATTRVFPPIPIHHNVPE